MNVDEGEEIWRRIEDGLLAGLREQNVELRKVIKMLAVLENISPSPTTIN
jgi:hypothetical protein